jgi:hypothetical protein
MASLRVMWLLTRFLLCLPWSQVDCVLPVFLYLVRLKAKLKRIAL